MLHPHPQAASASAGAASDPRAVGFTRTDALLALMVLLWGVNFIVVKAALGVFAPLSFNAVRFSIAAIAVVAVAWVSGSRRPAAALLPRLAALGILGNTCYQLAFIEGIARTRAGNAALLMAAVPVQTAVIGHFRGHERLRGRDVAGLALSCAGVAAIVLGSGREVGFGATVTGDLLVFAATVCWSLYTIGTKPLADALGSIAATAWTMAIGAVPLVLVAVPAVLAQEWRAVTPAAWGAVVFSSLGALVVGYLIWYHGVRRLGASRTAFFSNFTPVVALLAAWALLGEVPTLWQGLGAAGIFGGIGLTRT
ncbi:MAG: DMT family transporter [Gemmatimonadetes bacterium]|nr:DMT family transporter [Gemmatimonadota bacterium]